MNCPIDRGEPEVLLDYAAGRLDAATSRLLEHHFTACADCREFAAVQKTVWSALDVWEPAVISPDFNRRLYARIEREEERANFVVRHVRAIAARWSFSWRPLLPFAAAFAVLLLAVLIESPSGTMTPPSADSQARVETIDVEQLESALDDVDMLNQLGSVTNPGS